MLQQAGEGVSFVWSRPVGELPASLAHDELHAPPLSSTTTSLYKSKQEDDFRWKPMLQRYVSSVSSECYKCFILMLQKWIGMLHMLQWLYMYVSDVRSECFICFFIHLFASVLSGRCICFWKCFKCSCSRTYVVSVSYVCLKSRSDITASVLYAYFMCFIRLQKYVEMLHLNVWKVDWMLHLPPRFSILHRCLFHLWRRLCIHCPLPLFLDGGDARADAGPCGACKMA
jgi:hypothetical protein